MFFEHTRSRGALAAVLSLFLACPVVTFGAAPAAEAPAQGGHRAKAEKKPEKPAPGSSIEGQVFEANGKTPIRGARIVVRPLDGGDAIESLPTDSKGRFSVRHLRYGWNEVDVQTDAGEFLADQAVNLPPGTKVILSFTLVRTADRPATWWKSRADEIPSELLAEKAGLAEAKQKLTGVEYWKSPAGIAILAGVGVVALAAIAIGGRGYSPPAGSTPTTPTIPTTP